MKTGNLTSRYQAWRRRVVKERIKLATSLSHFITDTNINGGVQEEVSYVTMVVGLS